MLARQATRQGWTARVFGLIASGAMLGSTLAMSAAPAAYAAPSDQILWGAYVNAVPSDKGKIDQFETDAGKHAAILHWGQPWSLSGQYQAFQTSYFQSARDRGSIPMVNWGSWDYCCGTNQPQFTLASIAQGAHDSYIHAWASAAKAWGHPFFLRFDHEMNGWWQFPWAEQTNGNKSGEYVAAWRHVHDVFTQEGAANATWVWCPNISSAKTTPLNELYPGDNYVDWTCMDGYNFGSDNGNQWQTFSQVFAGSAFNDYHNTYQELQTIAPTKPVMIGETATSRDGGDPGAWVASALGTELPQNFPNIKALVWFNWNAGDPALSWPIESSTAIRSAFAQSISSDYYAANRFGAIDGGPVVSPSTLVTVAQAPATFGPTADDTYLAGVAPAD